MQVPIPVMVQVAPSGFTEYVRPSDIEGISANIGIHIRDTTNRVTKIPNNVRVFILILHVAVYGNAKTNSNETKPSFEFRREERTVS